MTDPNEELAQPATAPAAKDRTLNGKKTGGGTAKHGNGRTAKSGTTAGGQAKRGNGRAAKGGTTAGGQANGGNGRTISGETTRGRTVSGGIARGAEAKGGTAVGGSAKPRSAKARTAMTRTGKTRKIGTVRSRKATITARPVMILPDDLLERSLRAEGCRWVAGLDEVGRGAWAGPVRWASPSPRLGCRAPRACVTPSRCPKRIERPMFPLVAEWCLDWSVGHADPRSVIDGA